MKRMNWLALVGLAMTTACTELPGPDPDTDDTDSEFYAGPWQISTISAGCAADKWTIDITTDGLSGSIEISIFETGSWTGTNTADVWDELHIMNDNYDFDATTGTYDKWKLEMAVVSAIGDVVLTGANQTSLYACTSDNHTNGAGGSLAFMATMFDDSSPPVVEDRAIWGYEAHQYFVTDQGFTDAVCFDSDSD